ncbi:hypothetical protein [Streptomyces sp. NPDC050422]|uniref:hypothetical protein n=1 Tax=Streptomyces sp. NPDC050422 TaxID=3365614 RepID=UPI00378C3EF7
MSRSRVIPHRIRPGGWLIISLTGIALRGRVGVDRLRQVEGALVDARRWNGLVSVAKETYTASLGEGSVPSPLMIPLVRGELVGLVWVRPLKVGQEALAGIAELANIAAAAGADEVVLAWETHDVATACDLPIVGPAPCLNMVLATPAGHVLHQFP